MHVHHHAVLRERGVLRADAGGDRELLVCAHVAPLAMYRHRVLRTRRIVELQELTGVAVTGRVDVRLAVGDHLRANLRKVVDHGKDGFLVARDQRGRQDDRVSVADRDLAVLAARHARQRSHRFALRAGGDEHRLVRRHLGGLFDRDDGPLRGLEQAHLLRDLHVAQHGAAVKRDLAVVRHSGIDRHLHARHVGREGRDDHALLRLRNEAGQGVLDAGLRSGDTRDRGVGGVAEEEVHAFVAKPRQRGDVGGLAVVRGLVHLDVTGHDDVAGAGLDGHAQALRDGVADVPETQAELAEGHLGVLVHLVQLRALAVLLRLRGDERVGKSRGVDRDVRAQLEQPRDGPDVILVPVRDHEALDLVQLVLNGAEVRQDKVHTRFAGIGEEHATIHDEQLAVVLKDRHVAADLRNAAKRVDTQRVLRRLRRGGQALRQIRALHGLHRVAAATATATTSAATAPAAAVAATAVALVAVAVSAVLGVATVAATAVLAVAASVVGVVVTVAVGLVVGGLLGRRLERGLLLSRLRRARLAGHLAGAITGFVHT